MKKRQIRLTIRNDGDSPILTFLQEQTGRRLRKFLYELELLETSPVLGPPHVKAIRMAPGIFELRMRLGQMQRILFLLSEDGSAVLLCGFCKRHDRDLYKALRVARALRSALVSGEAYTRILDTREYENEKDEPPA